MTQEEKSLLLKDLCARLPYGCMYKASRKGTILFKLKLRLETIDKLSNDYYDEITPYLRPISSMTKEEKEEFNKVVFESQNIDGISASTYVSDWLISKQFDVRGLIEKGLALEAPRDMYKI